jgi:VWFA-related protein
MQRHITCSAVAAILAASVLFAQTPQRSPQVETSMVTAVVVDLVVRDRKGQPVTDLKAEDFQVFENGVRQEVGSFRRVARDPGGVFQPAARDADPAAAAAPAAAPPAEPAVVALVFDRLTPEARAFSHQAAVRYIGVGPQSANVVGVFSIDLTMDIVQGFTRDADAVRKALDRIAIRGSVATETDRERLRSLREAISGLQSTIGTAEAASANPAAAPEASAAIGSAAAAGIMRQMELRMLEGAEHLERDQQGHTAMNGLHALVNAMALLPGRKTMVFFSEGLQLPASVMHRFQSVIGAANRANVAVYALDAAGLRARSAQAETRDEVLSYGKQRLNETRPGASGGAAMRDLERNEDNLRYDPAAGLGQLSAQTGGLLIQSTNDLDGAFRRIEEDIRNHYVLTYTPSNAKFDGRYRTIEVKVRRPGAVVHARHGYFALPPNATSVPILAYEAPALALLDVSPVPNAFPIRARAFVFPQTPEASRVAVLVDVKANRLTYRTDQAKGTFNADFVVLARVRDANGQVVLKTSQRYEFNGPLAQMEKSKGGEVLFFRQPDVPPGVYTLETIVYDAAADQASVRISSLEVPKVDPDKPRLSSPFIVKRAEKVAANERDPDNPLYHGEVLLYPNVGEALSKAADKELAFAFTVYAPKGAAPQARVELVRDDVVVGQAPLQLGSPDAEGRIQQVSRLPLDKLAPGTYELRVTVQTGGDTVSRSVPFSIVAG